MKQKKVRHPEHELIHPDGTIGRNPLHTAGCSDSQVIQARLFVKSSTYLFLPALCAMGLLTGLSARWLSNPGQASTGGQVETNSQHLPPSDTPAADIPHARSTDTVETLTADAPAMLYSRLALWLADASEQDIARFWAASRKAELSGDITELVFLHWTRRNPQAAIAAASGTDAEHNAWWAWACHDPRSALEAANGEQVKYVARGIGEFQPKWLRQHFKELEEDVRNEAMNGVTQRADAEHPMETLLFLKENHLAPEPGTLRALARQDPWAALDWAKNNFSSGHPFAGGSGRSQSYELAQLVIDTLARDRPEDLKTLIRQTSSGELKLRMESAVFENLIASDPAAALRQAQSAPTSRIAAERYTALGRNALRNDPEQAFQLAKDLFTASPNPLGQWQKIEYPRGEGYPSFVVIPHAGEFLDSLMAKDPAKLMDLAISFSPTREHVLNFNSLSTRWAESDLGGFAKWLNQQSNGFAREAGISTISSRLQENGRFEEAAEWELSRTSNDADDLETFFDEWAEADPEAPERWLQDARLPPDRKAILQSLINRRK